MRLPFRRPRRRRRKPVAVRLSGTSVQKIPPGSSEFSQLAAEFPGSAEQRIFDRFFTRAQSVADGTQLEPLIVLHFENNPLARREALHRAVQPLLNFLPNQVTLGVGRGPLFLLALKEVRDALFIVC